MHNIKIRAENFFARAENNYSLIEIFHYINRIKLKELGNKNFHIDIDINSLN